MYGTVARFSLRPGAEAAMQALVREFDAIDPGIPGFRGELVYRSDRDPSEYYLAVLFDSREAYVANANHPEQHRRYLRLRELLSADPEWHDGEVVHSSLTPAASSR
jgi:heme-degrading monooxygenase HmoA